MLVSQVGEGGGETTSGSSAPGFAPPIWRRIKLIQKFAIVGGDGPVASGPASLPENDWCQRALVLVNAAKALAFPRALL